jgi:hypothetical protein
MLTEGTAVLGLLQAELDNTEQELAVCQEEVDQADKKMHGLLAGRGDVLVKLARHYLPEISRPAVAKTTTEIRGELLAIVARKDARRQELQQKLESCQGEAERTHANLDRVTALLNEKVKERERLEAQVADTLQHNQAFQVRSKQALQAEEQLHRNEQRSTDVEKEAAAKLPHYENSSLFRYLYERHFGTAEYHAGHFVTFVDSWVARLIDYRKARIGYEFLKKVPAAVAGEVGRRRQQFDELMQQVEALQHAEAERSGLTKVLQEGTALGAERDRLVAAFEQGEQQGQDLRQDLAKLEQVENQFYQEGIARFSKFLGETSEAVLMQRARATPEPQDDAMVNELSTLHAQIDTLESQAKDLTQRRQLTANCQSGLDALVRRYRQANFDSERSYYPQGLDLQADLARLKSGAANAEGIWQRIRSAQSFRAHWVDASVAAGSRGFNSPEGRILIGSILNAATNAMQNAAYRSASRRGPGSWSGPSFPSVPSAPTGGVSYAPRDGFTSGEGF